MLRVVDGDTIVIDFYGKKEKIRLLNVDTPESVHPDLSRNTPMGKKASDYTRNRLAGKSISLEFEKKKRGRYGRLLAYVIIKGQNFNLELVEEGWSQYYTKYGNSPTYHDQFSEAQARAWAEKKQIWDKAKSNRPNPAQTTAAAGEFHGNTKSHIFHAPGCRYFNCGNCTRIFSSQQTALRAGYTPCGVCRP